MSLYQPDAVTLWAIRAPSGVSVESIFEFTYTADDDDGNPRSRFSEAYRLDWYDEDFAELHTGGTARELLIDLSRTCRTLDEQALSRLPEGEWNGLYVVYGGAGDEWKSPDRRPPMPHHVLSIDGVEVKLIDTFHVLIRP